MSRDSDDRPAKPADQTASAADTRRVEPLRTMDWSELDTSADWPAHFIVRPDEPDMRAPSGVELPVLTALADPGAGDDWPDSQAPGEPASSFVPTVFGPKLRRVDDDGGGDHDDSALHADPDGAPTSLHAHRSPVANWSFLWLALLLLLGVAAAAWLWWPGLRQGG